MRTLFAIALLLALGGCATSEGPNCGGTAPTGGTWDVQGARTTAPSASLAGSLTVTTVDGCQFSGGMSIDETPTGGGPVASYAGTVNGSAVNDSVVNFDVQFSDMPVRTHIGVVSGDSLSGDWIQGSGNAVVRGTFRAHRTAP